VGAKEQDATDVVTIHDRTPARDPPTRQADSVQRGVRRMR
jgi:hypothetical protein